MKKSIVWLAALTLGSGVAVAQDASWGPFESTPAWANVYVGVDGGVQTIWGNSKLSPLRHNVDIQMGKWWNPFFSTRLKFEMGRFKTSEHTSEYRNQQFSSFTWHGDVLFNLTNIIGGYRPDRIYQISPFLGIGAEHSWGAGVGDGDRRATQGALFTGLVNSFRLSKAWHLNLELQGALMPKEIEGEATRGWRPHGQLSLMVGLSYTIGPRGFKGVTRSDCSQHQKRITQLERELNNCSQESRRYQQELQHARNNPPQPAPSQTQASGCAVNPPAGQKQVSCNGGASCPPKGGCPQCAPKSAACGGACGGGSCGQKGNGDGQQQRYMPEMAVFFDINSAKISARETLQLQLYADAIKAACCPYLIVGYADIQTGSLAYNEKLALKRAEAVVNMLVNKYGVNPALLKATVGNLQNPPFTDTIYNRTAIIRVP
jgi:outer membrane protein OmpA-like peptidoglycan-associated protein